MVLRCFLFSVLWQGGSQAFPSLDVSCKQDIKGIYANLPAVELNIAALRDSYDFHAVRFDFKGSSYMACLRS